LNNILELVGVGLYEGLVWFPFVLGVGILYRYLKIIDISIEGVAVVSALTTAFFYNISHSYFVSYIFSIFSAAISYSLVFLLIRKTRVHPILAGIIFTLIVHSLSAIIIGESYLLDDSLLFSGLFSFSWISLFAALLLIIFIEFFFRTNIGLQIRFEGQKNEINNSPKTNLKILIAFLVVSFVIGSGAFFYVHKQGVARSGSGFEFLVVALGSFLVTDKFSEYLIKKMLQKAKVKHRAFLFTSILKSPVFKAIAGSLLFQVIAIFVIFYSPNPSWWKLMFAFILLVGVIDIRKKNYSDINFSSSVEGICLKNINFSYKNTYTKIPLFTNLNCKFDKGIHIIQGDNGSGKTSLLKIIGRNIFPDSGIIEINKNFKYPQSIFYLTQNPFDSLNREMTVFENLVISLARNDIVITRFSTLKMLLNLRLKEFNMPLINHQDQEMFYQLAGSLSGGQAQRVLLFMSVLNNPQIVLADEPSSGMDNDNFRNLLTVMNSFTKAAKLIIIVTHDERLKKENAHHYILINGELIPQN